MATAKPQESKGGKSFKAETGKFDGLKVNESLTGTFMSVRLQTITDNRTKQPKELTVLKMRSVENPEKVYKLPMAAMLRQSWDDMVDEYGNGDQETAMRQLNGKKITVNRGPDTKTRGGDQMGTYEIIVWE